jgi:FkbM family methyltransferase
MPPASRISAYARRTVASFRTCPHRGRFLAAELIRITRVGPSFVSFVAADGSRLRLHAQSVPLGLWTGVYSDQSTLCFCLDTLDAGDAALDIGANVGHFSVAFARRVGRQGRVVSVEANPVVFRCLCDNLRLNKAECVQAVQAALWREEGLRLSFRVPRGASDQGALAPTERSGRAAAEFEVTTRSGDHVLVDLCAEGAPVALIKIDVEGAELRVLEGMRRTVARAACIVFEYDGDNCSAMGIDAAEVLALLRASGFTLFEFDAAQRTLLAMDDGRDGGDRVALRDPTAFCARTRYRIIDVRG